MTDNVIAIFLICFIGVFFYLCGYAAGIKLTLEEMNKQIEAKLKEKNGD